MVVFELSFVNVVDDLGFRSSPLVTVHVSEFAVHVLLFVDHVPHFFKSIADLLIVFLNDLNFKIKFLFTSVGLNQTDFLFQSFRYSL